MMSTSAQDLRPANPIRSRRLCARLLVTVVAAAIRLLCAREAVASPLDLSVDHTPKEQLTLAPYLFGYNSPGLETTQLYFIYGISDRVDLALAPGIQFAASPPLKPSPYVQSLYLRYFFIPELAIVAHGNWQPSEYVSLGVDLHFIKYWSHWSLAINTWWHPNYEYAAGLAPGNVALYVAPEYYFTPSFAAYVELDPTITWTSEAAGDELQRTRTFRAAPTLAVVPGIWVALPTVRKQSFSLGVATTFPVTGVNAVSVGLWYAVAFNQPGPDGPP